MSKKMRNIIIAVAAVIVVAVVAVVIATRDSGPEPTPTVTQDPPAVNAGANNDGIIAADPDDTTAEDVVDPNAVTEGDETEPDMDSQNVAQPNIPAYNYPKNVSNTTTTTKKPGSSTTKPTKKEDLNEDQKKELDKLEDKFGELQDLEEHDEWGPSLLSYKLDPEEGYFYTAQDAWQRNFGFNELYDKGAQAIVMYYDTVRIRFTHKGTDTDGVVKDLDWMVQLWKGQYGFLFLGAEIGLYHRPHNPDRPADEGIDHLQCATDANMIPMEMRMYNNKEIAFRRPYQKYWWCTGFVSGTLNNYNFTDRTQLVVEARLTFKDKEMAKKFADGLGAATSRNKYKFVQTDSIAKYNKNVYGLNNDYYELRGTEVFFIWRYVKQAL